MLQTANHNTGSSKNIPKSITTKLFSTKPTPITPPAVNAAIDDTRFLRIYCVPDIVSENSKYFLKFSIIIISLFIILIYLVVVVSNHQVQFFQLQY